MMAAKKHKILIVDDEPNFLRSMKDVLELEEFEVSTNLRARDALAFMQGNRADVMITDLRMPQMSGIELLRQVKTNWPETIVFMLTAYGSIRDAVMCMKLGAENYIMKPVNIKDLVGHLGQALANRANNGNSSSERKKESDVKLIGQSDAICNIRALVERVAKSDLSIIICGESGTGKELVANAIYRDSNRTNKPFLKINCAALPDHLLESELFGYEPGAFTDAKKLKRGKLELIHEGTLFLDEIGDMPVAMQAKLLRVLEEKRVERLGGNRAIPTDFRLLSATNQDLEKLISEGRFRGDLYFRLNALQIKLAPLREIRDDVPLLTEYYVQQIAFSLRINAPKIHQSTIEMLLRYYWPGNVRELRNVIHRAVVLNTGDEILPEHLPEQIRRQEFGRDAPDFPALLSLEEMERHHIMKVLQIADGNKNRTAALLNIHRDTLYRKLRKYELD